MTIEEPNALIKAALFKAVEHINNHKDSPEEAVTKVAKEFDLNPGFIEQVSRGLNTAMTYNHFKNAEDKAANFPVVDAEKVANEIFSAPVKTKQKQASEYFGVEDYASAPINFNKILNNPSFQSGYAKMGSNKEDKANDLTERGLFEKAAIELRDLEKQANDFATQKRSSQLQIDAKCEKLIHHFKKNAAYRIPFEEFESQVFAQRGEEAIPYLDLIYKAADLKETRGVHDNSYWTFELSKEAESFNNLFDELNKYAEISLFEKEATDLFNDTKQKFDSINKLVGGYSFKKEAAEVKKKLINKATEKLPEKVSEAELNYLEALTLTVKELSNLEKQSLEKKSFSPLDILFEKIKEVNKSKGGGGFKNKTLDNIERTAVIQELLMTDPILKKESPHKVISAFEAILRIAPQISREKELVRALLRQIVSQQAIGPFEANQLTETDINMMKQKLMQEGKLNQGR